MKKLLRKIILWALEEKNTTAANSDVKCYGTSDNPMTKTEWEKYKMSSKKGPNPI